MSSIFFITAVNILGLDCLDEAIHAIRNQGFRKALIVTDSGLALLRERACDSNRRQAFVGSATRMHSGR